MKYLFVPNNVLTILCEEQTVFRSLLSSSFYDCIPYCQIEKSSVGAVKLKLLPPENDNGMIIRRCFAIYAGKEKYEQFVGNFILGNAHKNASTLIKQIPDLKKRSSINKIFETLFCKARYTAHLEITKTGNLTEWKITNRQWEK